MYNHIAITYFVQLQIWRFNSVERDMAESINRTALAETRRLTSPVSTKKDDHIIWSYTEYCFSEVSPLSNNSTLANIHREERRECHLRND